MGSPKAQGRENIEMIYLLIDFHRADLRPGAAGKN
jgi:hypothetical protein